MKKIAATIVGTIVIVIACVLYLSTNVEGYTDISPYDLEKIVDKEEKVYVYFYSENCVTCRKIKSNLKELKKEDSAFKKMLEIRKRCEFNDQPYLYVLNSIKNSSNIYPIAPYRFGNEYQRFFCEYMWNEATIILDFPSST